MKKLNGYKFFLRMLALIGCLQAGCTSPFQKTQLSDDAQLRYTNSFLGELPSGERRFWRNFIEDYAQKSPTSKKLLADLLRQNARLKMFTKQAGKDNVFRAGESTENLLKLNRLIQTKGISLPDTFFHEGEHVIHLKRAHQHGINARSFSSLNDVYIYATLLEALAYRKAAICCAEYEKKLTEAEIQKKAKDVFERRLLTRHHDPNVRSSYERSAIILTNSETNQLPNQVYFDKNVDWNQIVSILSRSEVKEISVLPQPTLTFLSLCLLRELEKHPDAKELKDLDISCVLANKTSLQKDQLAIKTLISDHLMEVYDACQKKEKRLSKNMRNSFLYLIGWPDKQQHEQIESKKTTFKKVRDFNLSQFEIGELFDRAQELIKSPEVRAYNDPYIRHFEQILRFEKMILVPSKKQKIKTKQLTR